MAGLPSVPVLGGGYVHTSVTKSLATLGMGRGVVRRFVADDTGRMDVAALEAALVALGGAPAILLATVGDVNDGDADPVDRLADLAAAHGAWLHVDGAFGLFARIAPRSAHLAAGIERADSVIADAHKWLNVPYDSGIVVVRDRAAHHAAMSMGAAYYVLSEGAERDGFSVVPESSRRARGFAVYAALRELGREGLADLVRRCSALALRMAEGLAAADGVEVLNDVVLNQVLVRFGDSDELTRGVIAAVQRDGTCWLGGTTWHGKAAMRVSVSNWQTTEADIDRSAEAILRCAGAVTVDGRS
jgi:glutamate/tyrosine decarboxylase-like PLP-dependent enzyme